MDANTYLSQLSEKENLVLELTDAALSGNKKAEKIMNTFKLPYTKEGFTTAIDKIFPSMKTKKLSL